MSDVNNFAGKLLVAMPAIGDPRFDRAVILLCAHDDAHAMGLIVNKPRTSLTLADVLSHLSIEFEGPLTDRQVLDGGPVRADRGYVLHSDDRSFGEGTQEVAPGIRLSVTRDALQSLAGAEPPREAALALGYSGWGAGQLEDELARYAWLVAEPDREIVFGENHSEKWAAALRRIGVQPETLMGAAGHA